MRAGGRSSGIGVVRGEVKKQNRLMNSAYEASDSWLLLLELYTVGGSIWTRRPAISGSESLPTVLTGEDSPVVRSDEEDEGDMGIPPSSGKGTVRFRGDGEVS